MANNYTQATISPTIPTKLLTEVEQEILSLLGFTLHEYNSEEIYIVVEEHCLMDLEMFDDEEWEQSLGQPRPAEYVTVFDIFQQVIKRSLESGMDDPVEEVVIKGAFTCSKMRPDEFGGFVVRITKDEVFEGSTDMMLEHFRGNQTPLSDV